MPLSLDVTIVDAYNCFQQRNLVQLTTTGTSASGLPQSQPSVTITPDPSIESTRRVIKWDLRASIMATAAADDIVALRQTIDAVLSGATGAAGAVTGMPPQPNAAMNSLFDTLQALERIWEEDQIDKTFSIVGLPVKYKERLGRALRLTTKVTINGDWYVKEPGDDGNMAWVELEEHQVDSLPVHKAQPVQWDPSSGAPGGRNRIVMHPSNPNDKSGSLSGNIEDCRLPISVDQSSVSVKATASAVSDDDTVLVFINSLTLEMEIELVEDADRKVY